MATYIDLVNFALRESGSTLDQLVYNPPTTDTWTSPSDPLYTKFRQWVKQAWVDIQTERRDWEYMQESATVLLNPAMEVYGADGPNNVVGDFAGTVFRLHNSANAAFMTGSSLTIVDGAFADGDVEGYSKSRSLGTTGSSSLSRVILSQTLRDLQRRTLSVGAGTILRKQVLMGGTR